MFVQRQSIIADEKVAVNVNNAETTLLVEEEGFNTRGTRSDDQGGRAMQAGIPLGKLDEGHPVAVVLELRVNGEVLNLDRLFILGR